MKEILELAGSLGGFAGLACFGVIFLLGKEVKAMAAKLEKIVETLTMKMDRLAASWDRHSKMELMRFVTTPHLAAEVKEQIASQIRDIEDAQTKP